MRPERKREFERAVYRAENRLRLIEMRKAGGVAEVPNPWTPDISDEPDPLVSWLRRGGYTTVADGTFSSLGWFADAIGPIGDFLWQRETTDDAHAYGLDFHRQAYNLRVAVGLLPPFNALGNGYIDLGPQGSYSSSPDRGRPAEGLLRTRVDATDDTHWGGAGDVHTYLQSQWVGKVLYHDLPSDTATQNACASAAEPHDFLRWVPPGHNPTVSDFIFCSGPVGPAGWAADRQWFTSTPTNGIVSEPVAGAARFDEGQWIVSGAWGLDTYPSPDCEFLHGSNTCYGGDCVGFAYCDKCVGCNCADPCCEVQTPAVTTCFSRRAFDAGSPPDGRVQILCDGPSGCCGCASGCDPLDYPAVDYGGTLGVLYSGCCGCGFRDCTCPSDNIIGADHYQGCAWYGQYIYDQWCYRNPPCCDNHCAGVRAGQTFGLHGTDYLFVAALWKMAQGGGDPNSCNPNCFGCLRTESNYFGIQTGWFKTIAESLLAAVGPIKDATPVDRTARETWTGYLDSDPGLTDPRGALGVQINEGTDPDSQIRRGGRSTFFRQVGSIPEYGPAWWVLRNRIYNELATGNYPAVTVFYNAGVAAAQAEIALTDESGWKRVPLRKPWTGDAWYRRQGAIVEWKGTVTSRHNVAGPNDIFLMLIPEDAMPLVPPNGSNFAYDGNTVYRRWRAPVSCPDGAAWVEFAEFPESGFYGDFNDNGTFATKFATPGYTRRSGLARLVVDVAPFVDPGALAAPAPASMGTTYAAGDHEEIRLDGLAYIGADTPITNAADASPWLSSVPPLP